MGPQLPLTRHHFESDLQTVPGIGIPIGIASSARETRVFLYRSFEAPRRLFRKYRRALPRLVQ
jgi:hypothetical protein